MKFSEQWLREWANPDVDSGQLAEQLTMAGLEVDSVEAAAPPLDKVVVGHVKKLTPHPDADRLTLCDVDVGTDAPLKIVCGAPNVRAGGAYPVAVIGAVLPGGLKIKRSKIRGVESYGMLCSGVELGLSENAAGLLDLDPAATPGDSVVTVLGLDDQIIDLDLTPNRADCFSILGVGRDIAAVNGLSFSEPEVTPVKASVKDELPIGLAADDACPVFAGRVIRNIDPNAVTPLWMVERLRRSGVRALHPVVDVTNYVMLELGQPMHGYDLSLLNGEISARWAKAGEKVTLLDDQTIDLADDVLVIANDGAPVALAGIMGGASTAVSDTTRDIFLESAWFNPAALAGRARRYGMHTDASMRFERGVDFNGQLRAIERATTLLQEIAGGQAGPAVEARNADALPVRQAVELRRTNLARIIGIELDDETVTGMLERLGMAVEVTGQGWGVMPPSTRFDIEIEADLVEEVVRLYGYDSVPEIPQRTAPRLARTSETRVPVRRATEVLVDRGFNEIISYSFVDPERQQTLLGEKQELELSNPLSTELSVMRRSLWVGLLDTLSLNSKRQASRLRIFESGVSFSLQDNEIKENNMLSGLAWGPLLADNWDGGDAQTSLFDIKSDVEAVLALAGAPGHFQYIAAEHAALCPGRSARIERDGAEAGWIGELHPAVARQWGLSPAPIVFELSVDLCLAAKVPAYRPISRFPSVRRDLALVLDAAIPAADVIAAARQSAGDLLRDIMVFDVFTGKGIETGLKSVALGLILQETSRTLTELEIDEVTDSVKAHLSSKFNASIRE